MKKFLFSFCVCLLFFNSSGQTGLNEAKEQLKELKNSFILVRLKTNQRKIEALEERGYTKQAEEEKNRMYLENKETILSFQKTFDFCPVYFFYSDKSDDIRKGDLIGNVFDQNLKEIGAEKLSSENYFTAEFSKTENLGIHALILMDYYLVPLKAPFPFFQREYIFFSLIKQSKATIADRYNEKLHEHYIRWFEITE